MYSAKYRVLDVLIQISGVGAERGMRGIDPSSFKSRGINLPTFQAKLHVKIMLHGH